MATKKQAPEATEGTQETQDVAAPHEPRTTVPDAPRGFVGIESRDMVARITILLQGAQVAGREHVTAFEATATSVGQLVLRNLHPLVSRYRAEALDWLRGQHLKKVGLAEMERAEAVAGAKQANEELGK